MRYDGATAPPVSTGGEPPVDDGIWSETTDQTFDVRDLPPGRSFPLTGVDAFVRAQIEPQPARVNA